MAGVEILLIILLASLTGGALIAVITASGPPLEAEEREDPSDAVVRRVEQDLLIAAKFARNPDARWLWDHSSAARRREWKSDDDRAFS